MCSGEGVPSAIAVNASVSICLIEIRDYRNQVPESGGVAMAHILKYSCTIKGAGWKRPHTLARFR
jgi:hypothetical protein